MSNISTPILGFIFAFLISLLLSECKRAEAQSLSPYGMWEDFRPLDPQPPEWMIEENRALPELPTGRRPIIMPEEPEIVEFEYSYEPNTIVIDNASLTLYYILEPGVAYAYPISIGRDGFSWTGTEKISRISEWPEWIPPKEMRERQPDYPERMAGGLNNPLGAVAMYLGNTLYRIHGTNDPTSIGKRASSGCVRMLNEHAVHLSSLVQVGTTVYVVSDLSTQ